MPKIRALKPAFFTDERIVELTPLARLLYQGMWVYACDHGHIEDKPRQLKLRILPADDCDVEALLSEIERQQLVIRSDGWLTIPTLTEHQRPDKRYFLTCDYPGCKDHKPAISTHREAPADPEETPPDPDEDTTEPPINHQVTTSGPRGEPTGATRSPSTDGDGDGDGDGDRGVGSVAAKTSRKRSVTHRGTRIDPDFIPSATARADILAEHPALDLRREHAKFIDYWTAKPGKDGVKLDWHATWRNWMRRAADDVRSGARNGNRRQQETDSLFERAAARLGVEMGSDS